MSLSFETKPLLKENPQVEGQTELEPVEEVKVNPDDLPNCVFYASTLRWMDKVKVWLLSGTWPALDLSESKKNGSLSLEFFNAL